MTTSPCSDLEARHAARVGVVEQLWEQIDALQSQLRVELDALVRVDTAFPGRDYVADELSLLLAESPGTAVRWIDLAQRYLAFPAVVARVGVPLAEGGWSLRHADALLDAITGLGLDPAVQDEVIDLVAASADARTPHQVRKAAEAAVLVLDPEGSARRYEKATKDRGVSTVTDGAGATFYAQGTTGQVAALMAGVDALVGPATSDDGRTLGQRRFDVLMDLVCGRLAPGHWQAVVVVSLALLNGEDVPAEVPGLGLITAREARELLAHASLRRAVVDEHGVLVSLDTLVQTPDSTPVEPEPSTVTDAVDPTADIEADAEAEDLAAAQDQPSADDQTWAARIRTAQDVVVDHAMSDLEARIQQLLTQYVPVTVLTGPPGPVEITTERHHRRDDGPSNEGPPGSGPPSGGSGGGSGGPPPPVPPAPTDTAPVAGEDDHQAPSLSDELWNDRTRDRCAEDTSLPRPTYQREARPAPSTRAPELPSTDTSSWTLPALRRALTTVLTRPVEDKPLTSTAYALPPRLARFIKTRDLTCTFPGCTRLARDCQSDHVIPWPQGPSTADNTRSECVHHHQAKHHYFKVQALPNGGLRWTTPTGRTYDRTTRPLLRGR